MDKLEEREKARRGYGKEGLNSYGKGVAAT